jgi:spore coat polysaccharide biosynthesis predicted glycosyltransferase SpsG
MEQAPESFLRLLCSEGIQGRLLTRSEAQGVPVEGQLAVLDSYDFDTAVMRRWSRHNTVVVIDDWARDYFDCDAVISYAPEHHPDSYHGRSGCRYLVGPEYALLHSAFFAQPARSRDQVRRVFLGFGGADGANATRVALEALDPLALEIDVVLGPAYAHAESLAAWRCRPGVSFHKNVEQAQLACLMSQADAAIVAGGGMSLELCAVGVPSMLVAVADNQVRSCEALADRGMALYAGRIEELRAGDLRSCASTFFARGDLRRHMRERMRSLFLTSGTARVSEALCELVAERRRIV